MICGRKVKFNYLNFTQETEGNTLWLSFNAVGMRYPVLIYITLVVKMVKWTTQEDFIKRAKKIHNNLYDYSKVDAVDSNTPVTVICLEHGEFYPTPYNHTRDKNPTGCPVCATILRGKNRIEKASKVFVEKAKKIHGNKYDYSLVNYKKAKVYVSIICAIHGVFEVTPNNHLSGLGCAKCSKETTSKKTGQLKTKRAKESFEEKARRIHGDKYRYDKVDYKNADKEVWIYCNVHTKYFKQTPSNHLKGCGCYDCSIESIKQKLTKSQEQFLKEIIPIHPEYDFSKFVYKGSKSRGVLICPVHGIIKMTPADLLMGKKCRKCNASKGEAVIRKYLEFNKVRFKEQKTYPDCKYKNRLKFDFYLIDYNILIEYQGEHHYKPVKFAGMSQKKAEKNFEIQKVKDQIKREYCRDNGIYLLEIPYWDFKNTEEIIRQNTPLSE